MSVEKGVPFGLPLLDPRERRAKPQWKAKGRGKARGLGIQGPAQVRVCFLPELGSRVSPVGEKMWIPWDGLVVIGKRMELLGRSKQKPKKPKPKEDEETVWKAKSGLSQERNVRLLHRVATVLRSSVGLVQESPQEVWGKQEASLKSKVEAGSAGTTAGSTRQSGLRETPRFPGVGTSREDMRSRGHRPGQNEELSISGGKLKLSEERRRSRGEKLGSSGEDLNRRSRGEKLGSSGEDLNRRSRGEKLGSSGEDLKGSRIGSINEEKIERVVVKEFLALR